MNFRDEVKSVMKSKEQIVSELSDIEKKKEEQSLLNTSRIIFESIKKDILARSSRGDIQNGVIQGIVPIYYTKLGWNNGDMPEGYEGYFISATYKETHKKHETLFRFHTIHKDTIEIDNLPKVKKVHEILSDLCNQEEIEIGAFFLHACVFEAPFQRKLIREYNIPIQNNKLKYTLTYHTYNRNGNRTGESARIDLAVSYRFRI
ncbi:MAG: hypothetical protein IJL32_02555 [Oscillospiraceae bacterium]|nr:hypothetical protein [Oscillospiraceae bacterium]